MVTERLVIRRFQPGDWRALQEYVSMEEAMRFEPEYPKDDAGCRRLAEFFAGCDQFWAVCLKEGGKLIGHIHCGPCQPVEAGNWNLGFVFHPDYQGRGYATEASRRVMKHGFEVLGVRRFASGCNPENTPSWRLLERLGMRREAHHIQDGFLRRAPDGSPIIQDSFVYAILRDEWAARQE